MAFIYVHIDGKEPYKYRFEELTHDDSDIYHFYGG